MLIIIIIVDIQALPKAKYCPRVAAVSCMEKNKKDVTLTLAFNRVLAVVNVHVHAKFHQAKYSSS